MSDLQRIGVSWPRPPNLEGVPSAHAQRVLDMLLPFSVEDPLIFHVLTTVDHYELPKLMASGASLVPNSWVEGKRWGSKESLIRPRDAVAGDSDYVFLTPCNVWNTYDERAKYGPAVAFRLSYIASVARGMGFRVHDLERLYVSVEDRLVGDVYDEDHDEDHDEEPSQTELEARRAENVAEAVQEQLEALADCGTQWDMADAVKLTKLYAKRLYRGGSQVMPSIVSKAKALFPCADSDEWARDLLIEQEVQQIQDDWTDLFSEQLQNFPYSLLITNKSSELLVSGELALCEAAFYRTEDRRWLPVTYETCLDGRRSREE